MTDEKTTKEEQTKAALLETIREMAHENDYLHGQIQLALRGKTIAASMAMPMADVPARGNSITCAHPQVMFRPERICVKDTCATHFLIGAIRVGMKYQMVSSEPLPASLFAVPNLHQLREVETEDEFTAPIPHTFDVIVPGLLFTIDVQRIDDSTMPFECIVLGQTIEDPIAFPAGPLVRRQRRPTSL